MMAVLSVTDVAKLGFSLLNIFSCTRLICYTLQNLPGVTESMRGFLISLLFLSLPTVSSGNSIQQLQNELQQKKYSRAATTGLSLLRQKPDDVQVLFLTALAFQHNKQLEQASRYYREIVKQQPGLPEPLNNLAMIQLQQGNHDQAVDLLIASLQTHPAYATAWQNLSSLYRGLASEAYRKALSEEKDTSQVMDEIQLVALTDLHSPPAAGPAKLKTADATVQLASAENKTPATAFIAQQNPIQVPQESKPSTVTDAELMQVVRDWATAWSSKDFDTYIDAYAGSYRGRQGSHSAWVKHRRSRIVRPGKIDVKVDKIRVKSRSNTRAIVDFHQAFKSATYRDKVVKRIVLSNINGRWLITRETTISVL